MTVSMVEFGSANGHQPHYLRLIAEAWRARPGDDELVVSVRSRLLERHPEVGSAFNGTDRLKIRTLKTEAEATLERAFERFKVPFASILPGAAPHPSVLALWQVAQEEARSCGAQHLFLLEMDRCLPALAAKLPAACPVSGIWFKPRFHSGRLGWLGAESAAFEAAEKWMAARALANPDLKALLLLDPFAAEQARLLPGGQKVGWLTDPVALANRRSIDRSIARTTIGVQPHRFAILHFGELGLRKGVAELLKACSLLPADVAPRTALIIAGAPSDISIDRLERELETVRRRGCQTVLLAEYVSDERASLLFAAADLVSVAYRRQAGMSGVLLMAAAACRPVICQPEGLIAALTREHGLGAVLSDPGPETVASELSAIIAQNRVPGFDQSKAAAFSARHHPRNFQDQIIEALLRPA